MANFIIQKHFAKLEEYLDLHSILGKLYSKQLFNRKNMQKFQSLKDIRIDQNRAVLDYLETQPMEQLKCFFHVLQEDYCNPSHQKIAKEMLDAISDYSRSDLLDTTANQLSQNQDARGSSSRATFVHCQMKYNPQQPHMPTTNLLLVIKIDGVGVTVYPPKEVFPVYVSQTLV